MIGLGLGRGWDRPEVERKTGYPPEGQRKIEEEEENGEEEEDGGGGQGVFIGGHK